MLQRGRSSPNFKKGICILVTIVTIFGISYLARTVNDALTFRSGWPRTIYGSMTYDLWMGIPYDFIPFMLILCLHRKNFKKKVVEKYAYADDMLDP